MGSYARLGAKSHQRDPARHWYRQISNRISRHPMTFESVRSKGGHPAVGDFTWHRLGQPRMTGAQIADKGRRSIRRLKEWGVEVPVTCRLVRATELVESAL